MIINKKQFQRAIGLAVRIADKKNVIPVLSTVRMTLDDSLRLYATNLDSSVEVIVDATGDPFDVRVETKLLNGILSRLTDDELTIAVTEKDFIIKRQSGDIKIRLTKAEDVPEEISFDAPVGASFSSDVLKDTFHAVLCGTAEDKILSGFRDVVQFTFDDGFKCVSTDTQRIVVVTGKADVVVGDEIIMPLPAVRQLLSVLTEIGDVSVGQTMNHLIVTADGVKYAFRKMLVQYPNVQAFFDKVSFDWTASVNADTFRNSLELVATMMDIRLKSAKWILADNQITLSCESESGVISEDIAVSGELPDASTKYALNFVVPIFGQLDGDVEIAFAQTNHVGNKGETVHTYPMMITHRSSVTSSYCIQSMKF